ncbi:MAG TPA: glycosyltransferase family 4 protein [Rhizomicrobium sp.]|nr:glycosyltransferase family 4 protein [Rhizomicrobium sp.]
MKKTKKKIIGVISFMNPAGAQEAMLRLMNQLRLRGHETEVWFLYAKSHCYSGHPGVRILLSRPRLSLVDTVRMFFRLVRLLRQSRPDVVVGFLPLATIMGLAAAAIAGVKLRIASQRSPGATFGRLMRRLDRICGAHGVYSRIVCVSEAVRQSFLLHPPAYVRRLCVVNNGIAWQPSSLEKDQARASFGIPPDFPLVVGTGRFVPQKNYDLMIRVMATTPRLRLAIAGDGPLHASAEALAQDLCAGDRIHFLGALAHDRVADLLRASDGFIQTSLFEGQSNSTLEAMHEGLPIVCSDIPMQRETVCEENGDSTALLVPLDDFEGWREALLHLRDEPEAAAELGARARALVSRRFTLQRMIDGFENVILEKETREWALPGSNACAVGRADSTP